MIQGVVDQNAFHIGNQYLSENRVRIVEADDSKISSAVIGNSGLYEQTIRLKDGHLVSRCSCSLPEEPMCRHCIAVLLEYHRWVQPRTSARRPKPAATSAAPHGNGNTGQGASASGSGADLKLNEVMAFIEWVQSAVQAVELGQILPDGSRLAGEVGRWAQTIGMLDQSRRESQEIQMTLAAEQKEREAYIGRMAQQLQASIDEAKAALDTSRQLQQELGAYRDMVARIADIASEVGGYDSQIKSIAGELLSKGAQLEKLSASFREVAAALKAVVKPPSAQ